MRDKIHRICGLPPNSNASPSQRKNYHKCVRRVLGWKPSSDNSSSESVASRYGQDWCHSDSSDSRIGSCSPPRCSPKNTAAAHKLGSALKNITNRKNECRQLSSLACWHNQSACDARRIAEQREQDILERIARTQNEEREAIRSYEDEIANQSPRTRRANVEWESENWKFLGHGVRKTRRSKGTRVCKSKRSGRKGTRVRKGKRSTRRKGKRSTRRNGKRSSHRRKGTRGRRVK